MKDLEGELDRLYALDPDEFAAIVRAFG